MKTLMVLFLACISFLAQATAGTVFMVDSSGNIYTEDKNLLPALKSKLIADIKSLPDSDTFEVVFYVAGYKTLFSALVPASAENKGKAIDAITGIPANSNGLPANAFGKTVAPDKLLHGFSAFAYAYGLSPDKIKLYSDGDIISERQGTKPFTEAEIADEIKKLAGSSSAPLEVVFFKNPSNDKNYASLARKVASAGNGSVDLIKY